MTTLSFLAGLVVKQSLPAFSIPPGVDGPKLKRLLLPQGELTQLYDADSPVRYIALIELKACGIRGNHYHRIKEEMLYVAQGELELIVEDSASCKRETVALQAGDSAVIRTGVAHAMKTVTPGFAIEFAGTRFDPADIHRYPLI